MASQAEEYRGNDPIEIYYDRYGGKSFHEQSHGESFLSLLQGALSADGIYILDEPEAALSPQRQLTLLIEILLQRIHPFFWLFQKQVFYHLIMEPLNPVIIPKHQFIKSLRCLLIIEIIS